MAKVSDKKLVGYIESNDKEAVKAYVKEGAAVPKAALIQLCNYIHNNPDLNDVAFPYIAKQFKKVGITKKNVGSFIGCVSGSSSLSEAFGKALVSKQRELYKPFIQLGASVGLAIESVADFAKSGSKDALQEEIRYIVSKDFADKNELTTFLVPTLTKLGTIDLSQDILKKQKLDFPSELKALSTSIAYIHADESINKKLVSWGMEILYKNLKNKKSLHFLSENACEDASVFDNEEDYKLFGVNNTSDTAKLIKFVCIHGSKEQVEFLYRNVIDVLSLGKKTNQNDLEALTSARNSLLGYALVGFARFGENKTISEIIGKIRTPKERLIQYTNILNSKALVNAIEGVHPSTVQLLFENQGMVFRLAEGSEVTPLKSALLTNDPKIIDIVVRKIFEEISVNDTKFSDLGKVIKSFKEEERSGVIDLLKRKATEQAPGLLGGLNELEKRLIPHKEEVLQPIPVEDHPSTITQRTFKDRVISITKKVEQSLGKYPNISKEDQAILCQEIVGEITSNIGTTKRDATVLYYASETKEHESIRRTKGWGKKVEILVDQTVLAKGGKDQPAIIDSIQENTEKKISACEVLFIWLDDLKRPGQIVIDGDGNPLQSWKKNVIVENLKGQLKRFSEDKRNFTENNKHTEGLVLELVNTTKGIEWLSEPSKKELVRKVADATDSMYEIGQMAAKESIDRLLKERSKTNS